MSELVGGFLERVHQAQPVLHAFITITDEAAIAAAIRIDHDFAAGIDRGPLQGIPIAIKDAFATEDAPTTANSNALDPSWGQRADAAAVRRLRDAGAISLGKLALHEFGNGWPDPATGFGIARNPWDPTRAPGGSSTGLGSAVAAGLVLGGLGSDSGGSLRVPAHFSGVTGVKPTAGLVSLEGAIPLAPTLDTAGPIATDAWDAALLLGALAEQGRPGPGVPADLTRRCDGSVEGVRVGVPRRFFFEDPTNDPEIVASVEAALQTLAGAGAELVDIELPHGPEAVAATIIILRCEAYAYHRAALQSRFTDYGRYCGGQMIMGAFYSSADYVDAHRIRAAVRSAWRSAMEPVDVLMLPVLPMTAPRFEDYDVDAGVASPRCMGVFNLVGLPAMVLPCGLSTIGLPMGVQIVGKTFDEATMFRVGHGYQQLTDWHRRRPPSHGGVSR